MPYCRGVKLIQCCGPHLKTWIIYGPDSLEKKIEQPRLYISGPETFCLPAQKPVDQISRYCHGIVWRSPMLRATISGNCVMHTRNGADLQRNKKVITSLAATCNTICALLQLLTIISWLFSRNFNLKHFFLLENNFSKLKFGGQAFALYHKILRRRPHLVRWPPV